MAMASFIQHSFLGGEWSTSMQGRIDRPDYRTALNVCLNMLPIEQGAMVRRPGTQFAGTTRSGVAAREFKFEFEAAAPYRIEFTPGHMRFRVGSLLVPEPEQQTVLAQTGGSPVELTVSAAPVIPFATGNDVYFPASVDPLIRNRQFRITVIDQTHMTLTDPVTGANIDGSVITDFTGLTMYRVFDVVTPYGFPQIESLRLVQAEERAILLNGSVAPTVLQALTNPTSTLDVNGQPFLPSLTFTSASFLDGPYQDPIPNGAQITPGATGNGIITFTVSFPTYSASIVYTVGSFVHSSGADYKSLIDANLNNTPASSPTAWQAVSTGIAIGPNGFVGSDVGRLMRFYSQPAPWNVATTYASGNIVSYPNGVDGGVSYWQSLINSNTGVPPGTNASDWSLIADSAAAVWTWGKITSLTSFIPPTNGASETSTPIGNLTNIAASFDGTVSKSSTNCSLATSTGNTIDQFVGLHMTGSSNPQAISSVTVYPSSDKGFAFGTVFFVGGGSETTIPQTTINLRGSASAPSGPSNGTLLGTTNVLSNVNAAVTIPSKDTATAYNYLWVEVVAFIPVFGLQILNSVYVAQVEFFAAVAGSVSNAVKVEILGQPILYTSPITTWQLGLFSNTTGYPTCGVFHEGRVWFSGVLGNRVDASVSNGLLANGQINMAPTNPDGSVSDNNGISYVFNADDTNPIFWLSSDQVGIICGTQGGEWLIQASNLNNPLSATNMQAKRFAKNRCANVEPRRTPGPLAVVQLYQEKILEYFADVFSGRTVAQNLSWKCPQITAQKVAELAFMAERAPVVWGRLVNQLPTESFMGITYKRENLMSSQEPNFAGGHRHNLGGGYTVNGICEASTADGSLSTVSLVTATPGGVFHVQLMSNILLETDNPANAWQVDNAVIPASSTVAAGGALVYGGVLMSGLWHLNGSTVSVYAGGLDCGDYVVSNGSITVPFGDGIEAGTGGGLFTQAFFQANPQIVVGLNYLSQMQIVRPILPAESGARNGPALGKKRRVHKYSILCANTAGLNVGSTFSRLYPVLFKSVTNVPMPPGQFFTGIYHDTFVDDYTYDGMLSFEIARPLPAIISAVEAFVETQDE